MIDNKHKTIIDSAMGKLKDNNYEANHIAADIVKQIEEGRFTFGDIVDIVQEPEFFDGDTVYNCLALALGRRLSLKDIKTIKQEDVHKIFGMAEDSKSLWRSPPRGDDVLVDCYFLGKEIRSYAKNIQRIRNLEKEETEKKRKGAEIRNRKRLKENERLELKKERLLPSLRRKNKDIRGY